MPPVDTNTPVPAPEQSKKPGFFARLFGKKSATVVQAPRESLTPQPQLDDTQSSVSPAVSSPVEPAAPAVPEAPVADPTATPSSSFGTPASDPTTVLTPPTEEPPKTTPPTTPAV